ncbi:flagellar protein essential for flagellar pocket biogenesis [Diplonema papillatum]|nr:flagellar protein essential for flagellar pocket biogenesis [Diplonema papillatum]
MVFTVLTAVDLGGKCNYELSFPTVPTISELRDRIDEVMSAEAALRRPPQAGLFQVHRAQVFDERMEMWVDLVASSQLEDYCQVYIFQKESLWHKETPGRIPPPTKPVASSPHYRRSGTPPPYESYIAPLYDSSSAFGSPFIGNSPIRGYTTHSPGLDQSTYTDKVRVVYEELDANKTRAVSVDDWNTCFQRLRLTGGGDMLTDATVDDLFHKKADRNEDGVVSFPEFQQFSEVYPKLLDSMYYRSKRHQQEMMRKDRIKQQHAHMTELEKKHDEARQAAIEAENEAMVAQRKIDEADGELESAKRRESEALQTKQDAHNGSERARDRLRNAKTDEAQVKEQLKRRETSQRAAQRTVEAAEKKHKQETSELDKLGRELEALQRKVQEKQAEIERQERNVKSAEGEIDTCEKKARELDDPQLDREAQDKQKACLEAEDDLKKTVQIENDRAQDLRNAQRTVAQVQQQKQLAEKEVSSAGMKESQRKSAEQRSAKAVEDQRAAIEQAEAREEEMDAKREEQEAKENELLQMEVRLREQREAVERKEDFLRSAHREFSHENGRVSPTRGVYEA